jgi:hypothetical protein
VIEGKELELPVITTHVWLALWTFLLFVSLSLMCPCMISDAFLACLFLTHVHG